MHTLETNLAGSAAKQKISSLVDAACSSPSFRAQLIAEPQKSVENFLGVKLPEGIKVRVIEDTPDTLTIVVPPKIKRDIPDATLSLSRLGELVGAAYSSIISCPSK